MVDSALRFGRAYLLPILLFLVYRYAKIRQTRRKLSESGVQLGGFLDGIEALLRKHLLTSLIGMHAERGSVVAFISRGPAEAVYSLSNSNAVRRLMTTSGKLTSDGDAQNHKELVKNLVRASLKDVRNWDCGSVHIVPSVDEIILPLILDYSLKGLEWRSQLPLLNTELKVKCDTYYQKPTVIDYLKRILAIGRLDDKPFVKSLSSLSQVMKKLVTASVNNENSAQQSTDVEALSTQINDLFNLTASLICWLLVDFANEQAFQDVVVREIDTKIGRRMPPTLQEVRNLASLYEFSLESMRMHSPIPIQEMVTSRTIQVDETIIPPKTRVLLSVYCANRDAQLFDNPNQFNLSRFTTNKDEQNVESHPTLILPPTPHLNVALDLARTFVVVVMQRFRIHLAPTEPTGFLDGDDEETLRMGFLLPHESVACTFEPRKSQSTL